MCSPIVGAVLGLVGGVVQGIGAAQQNETNAVNYEANAASIDRDIASEGYAAASEVAKSQQTSASTAGRNRANAAASGLALQGSVAEVLTQNAIEADLDVATIRYNSKTKIAGMEYERDVNLWNAGQERAAKSTSFLTSVLGGAATFGGSFG